MAILLRLLAVDQDAGVLRVGEADDLVAPRDELRSHVLGRVEQAGEDRDRIVGGDRIDEVHLLLLQGGFDGHRRKTAQEVLVATQLGGAEVAHEELAQRLVAWPVRLEDGTTTLLELLGRLLEIGELHRGEGLGVLVDLLDVVVARDRPEARAAVVFLGPVAGRLGTERLEHSPCLVALERGQVGEVNLVERHRSRTHAHSFNKNGIGECREIVWNRTTTWS